MIVTRRESNHQAKLAIGSEPEYLPDRTQKDEFVPQSCGHADQPRHGLAVSTRGFRARQNRNEQIGPPRQGPVLVEIDPKD